MSWQDIRILVEKFEYKDPRTGVTVTGFNVPEAAKKTARRKSFHITYLTLDGHVESGVCTCIKTFTQGNPVTHKGCHQRLLQFVESGAIRRVSDILIIEIDGIRIIAQ